MEIFRNTPTPYYDQLVKAGPAWLAEFREMDANYQFAAWTLELGAHFLDRMIQNEFPAYCDEEHLIIFERLLNIEYEREVTMEERRRTVCAYWSGNGKISKSTIEGMVSTYTGHEADVRWEGTTLVIDFDNTDTINVYLSMLQRILRRRMPAHIDYRLRCAASVKVGIKPERKCWKHIFDQAGTKPDVSTGLAFRRADLEMDPEGTGWKSKRPMTGEVEAVTGTYPKTSTGLGLNEDGLVSEINATGWQVSYRLCGEEL